jgi:hypothetical protein
MLPPPLHLVSVNPCPMTPSSVPLPEMSQLNCWLISETDEVTVRVKPLPVPLLRNHIRLSQSRPEHDRRGPLGDSIGSLTGQPSINSAGFVELCAEAPSGIETGSRGRGPLGLVEEQLTRIGCFVRSHEHAFGFAGVDSGWFTWSPRLFGQLS